MCPDLEELELFATGRLTGDALNSAESHVSGCQVCRALVAEVRENLRVGARVAAQLVEPIAAGATLGPSETTETDAPGIAGGSAAGAAETAANTFPGYEIAHELSRGGQGVVYQAVQKSTRRKVAIKVLRHGHFADSRERARFEREVQILGQLKHPNIVTIYDSGNVGGRAFFVMDYIPGVPLEEHTAHSRLSITDILRLFAQVCEAVHAAHLRGIIHRDLKPSNIRIDMDGKPHVLDFGLAKFAGAPEVDDSGAPAMTMTGQFLGSLPWSSPEQAEGQPSKIDVRTDVYSLGVILFRLLTGCFPYDVSGSMHDVLERIMRVEAPRPSGAASAAAHGRIDDEVDTIVLKALAKERERRYQSAGELARDIQHYLAGEPIAAKRDSGLYMLRKTLRRYRVSVAVGAMFVVLLVCGLVGVVRWRYAEKERSIAVAAATEQARLRTTAESAQKTAEEARAAADQSREQAVQAREEAELRTSEARRARAFAEQRGRQAQQMADGLVVLLQTKGDFAKAEPWFRRALAEAREEYGDEHLHVATCAQNLAGVLRAKGEYTGAEKLYDEAMRLRRKLLEGEHPLIARSLCDLAALHYDQGDFAQAAKLYREALTLLQRRREPPPRLVPVQVSLARALLRMGQFREAEEHLLLAYDDLHGPEKLPLTEVRETYTTLVELYTAWEDSEPGRGSAAEAAKWRAGLERMPSTQPGP